MEEQQDPKNRLETLEVKKRELLDRMRKVNNAMRDKREEVIRLVPSLRGKAWLRGEKTKSAVDTIEFEISTQAFTPAQERMLLKKLKKAQEDMDAALKLDGMRGKVDEARKVMGSLAAERDALDAGLKAVRADLETTYKAILEGNANAFKQRNEKREGQRQQREGHRQDSERERFQRQKFDRRKEEEKENAQYMKQHDDFVPLEEIAEIKRKKE